MGHGSESRGGGVRRIRPGKIWPVVIWVVAGILVVTGVLSVSAWSLNDRTEHRLLREQLHQAGGTLTGAAGNIQQSLAAAAIAAAAPTSTNVAAFGRITTPLVGEDRRFASVSLWAPDGAEPLHVVGAPPALLELSPARRRAALAKAGTEHMTVVNLLGRSTPRLGFATVGEGESQRLIAYGESALPANRTAVPQADDPYENVDYALYLGGGRGELMIASTSELPLEGSLERERLAFGDTQLQLEFASRANFAGWLSANLYWIIALSGIALAALAGFTLQWISTRRDRAAALAAENAALYREQRNIAVALQHSLLPDQLGGIPDVEVVARYEPGAERTEVGGDWYDAMPVPGGALFVVVGDVSGHGIKAAATMASLRFATRAYAAEGGQPAMVLTKLGKLLDVGDGAEFATVLCARLDPQRSRLVVADAGHPSPVLADAAGTRFVEVPHGPPIGVPSRAYREVEVRLAEAGTLVAFTDGLVERRGEPIDDGLRRLLGSFPDTDAPLADLVASLADGARSAGHDDDLAILGVRWNTTTPS